MGSFSTDGEYTAKVHQAWKVWSQIGFYFDFASSLSYFISFPVSVTFLIFLSFLLNNIFKKSITQTRNNIFHKFEPVEENCFCFFFFPQWPHPSDGDRDQSGRCSRAQDPSQIRRPRVCQCKSLHAVFTAELPDNTSMPARSCLK